MLLVPLLSDDVVIVLLLFRGDDFVVDNFFDLKVAQALELQFPDFKDPVWHEYGNAIEVKKVCNNWNVYLITKSQVKSSNDMVTVSFKQLSGRSPLPTEAGLRPLG